MQLLLQQGEADRVGRHDRLGVLDQVTELGVAVLAERRVQRDRLAAVLLDLDDLLRGHVELLGELLRRGLAAEVLQHLPLHAGELVDHLDHVHRDADGAGLVGHRAGDRLPDPPGRVRGELVALGVVELLDRADQTEVALLDQVQEEHAAAGVALGQRDHEAQVGLEQVVLGPPAVLGDPLEVVDARRP